MDTLRSAVRRRLLLYGVCAVLAGGCVSFMTIIALDWLFVLPPELRLLGASLFVIGCGLATLHWIVWPMRACIDAPQLAARLERHFPHLRDELSSAVGFLRGSGVGSVAMITRVLSRAGGALSDIPVCSVLNPGPLRRQAAVLAVAAGALVMVFVDGRAWLEVGVRRYWAPFESADWPTRVAVVPETEHITVPEGESATVRMRITRGDRPNMLARLHIRDADGNETQYAMQRGGGHWVCDVPAVTTPLLFWFRAGDADTRRDPGRITPLDRPTVADIYACISPPDYVTDAARARVDLETGHAAALVGSEITVAVRPEGPSIRTGDSGRGRAWLECDDGEPLALRPSSDGGTLTAQLKLAADMRFRVRLIDRHGCMGGGERVYEIRAQQDQAPAIRIVEPWGTCETATGAIVPVVAEASDDFGLSELRLVTRRRGEELESTTPLQARTVRRTAEPVHADIRYEWRLDAESSNVPRVVEYCLEVADSRPGAFGGAQITRTAWRDVHVISRADMQARIRAEIARCRATLERALGSQQHWVERSRTCSANQSPACLQDGRRELQELAVGQQRLNADVRGLAARCARLAQRMRHNGVRVPVAAARVAKLGRDLKNTAEGPMHSAGMALLLILDEKTAPCAADWRQPAEMQSEAVVALENLVLRMGDWSDFDDLLARTEQLYDEQQRLSHRGAALKSNGGAEFAHSQEARMRDAEGLRAAQQLLAASLRRLLQRLDGITFGRPRSAAQDPDQVALTSAVGAALRAARATRVQHHASEAVQAFGDARLAAAHFEQRQALSGLRRMLASLQRREARRLAELARRLQSADAQIARLLEEQRALLEVTSEAVGRHLDRPLWAAWSAEQRRLSRNARQVAREIEALSDAAAAARVGTASEVMVQAVAYLAAAAAESAASAQRQACVELQRALDILRRQAQRAAHDAFREIAAALRARLERIRKRQRQINDGTRNIVKQMQTSKRLTRAIARAATHLAAEQRDARDETAIVEDDLTATVVYRAIIDTVRTDMRSAIDALDDRRLDAALISVQDHALRRLVQLIDALTRAATMPPRDEFVDGATGGGGGGAHGDRPPVPPTAELLMIRIMQQELSAKTEALNADWQPGNPTEEQLQRAVTLGRRQQELKQWTQRVVSKARNK